MVDKQGKVFRLSPRVRKLLESFIEKQGFDPAFRFNKKVNMALWILLNENKEK